MIGELIAALLHFALGAAFLWAGILQFFDKGDPIAAVVVTVIGLGVFSYGVPKFLRAVGREDIIEKHDRGSADDL